jgi:hypothetical protein
LIEKEVSMKVYYIGTRFFQGMPQIKISNKKMEESGFKIGKEFEITYEQNKIVLSLKESLTNDYNSTNLLTEKQRG